MANHYLNFTIVGDPVAKQRARVICRAGMVRAYTPSKTVNYEEIVRITAMEAMGRRKKIEGPLTVDLTFFLKKPASSKNFYPVVKPDIDNLVKSILDGFKGVIFEDDKQIIVVTARKFYLDSSRGYVSVFIGVLEDNGRENHE
jgi:Holliday junction resolvase RusA-like endonuclease